MSESVTVGEAAKHAFIGFVLEIVVSFIVLVILSFIYFLFDFLKSSVPVKPKQENIDWYKAKYGLDKSSGTVLSVDWFWTRPNILLSRHSVDPRSKGISSGMFSCTIAWWSLLGPLSIFRQGTEYQ